MGLVKLWMNNFLHTLRSHFKIDMRKIEILQRNENMKTREKKEEQSVEKFLTLSKSKMSIQVERLYGSKMSIRAWDI